MGEIIQDDVVFSANTHSVTTPLAAFASESLLPMDHIVTLKQDPPPMTCLIHAIILSDDKLVIAKSSIANLRQSSIPVQEFKEQFFFFLGNFYTDTKKKEKRMIKSFILNT